MSLTHQSFEQLERALPNISHSPKTRGSVELIVRRPATDQRELVEAAQLDTSTGLVGDKWSKGQQPKPECQLTLMNSRVISAIAGEKSAWPPAGDQLYVDLDLSAANLPPGTQLKLGDAIIEVSAYPHTGCKKFLARFGGEAKEFVNSKLGLELRLRGVNARVIRSGTVRVGDPVEKIA